MPNSRSMTPKEAETAAQREAYRADPQAAAKRASQARKDRRVTLRPAPDTMSLLSGLLPVEQGVACYAALRREADTRRAGGDERREERGEEERRPETAGDRLLDRADELVAHRR